MTRCSGRLTRDLGRTFARLPIQVLSGSFNLIGNSFDLSSCASDDLPKALLCLSGNIFSCPAIRFSSALLLAALPRLLIALVRLLLTTLVGIVCLVHALLFLPHANQTSSIGMFRHAVMLHPAMSNDIHGFGP